MSTKIKFGSERAAEIEKFTQECISLARKSDCSESNYGAVIVHEGKVVGSGYNHIPEVLAGEYTCSACPRRNVELHGGVGFELCVTIHAEEAAIQDFYARNGFNKELLSKSTMIVERLNKEGELSVFDSKFVPYCTKCAGEVYKAELKEVVYHRSDGFMSFSAKELVVDSVASLEANWRRQISEFAKKD